VEAVVCLANDDGGTLLEHEVTVLQLAAAPQGATRRAVAAMTGLSSDQAKRLLARLVADGRLFEQGKGRGVTYRLGAGAKRAGV
jgi:predicted HTH transcriptional regulator